MAQSPNFYTVAEQLIQEMQREALEGGRIEDASQQALPLEHEAPGPVDLAEQEPDYQAMSEKQWREYQPEPWIDEAEAYADVAGDATLSWRLEDEDPIDILDSVRNEIRAEHGITDDPLEPVRSHGHDTGR